MKKFKITAIGLSVIVGFVFTESAMAGRVANRQVRQQARIHQGVDSGELTANETKRLEKTQRRIRKSKRQAWSDGQLTNKEKLRLEKQQDRASHQIYRLKHNEQDQMKQQD